MYYILIQPASTKTFFFFQDYYHSYLPRAYETCRFGDYEVTIDSENTRGDIVVKELRMVSIKVHHLQLYVVSCATTDLVKVVLIGTL